MEANSQIHSHYFTTSDGAKMHYLQAGEGAPMVMLPGGGLSAAIFQHQLPEFSKIRKVFSLDKRGHGLSEKVEYGYRVSRFAKDLREFIQHEHLSNIALVCHSLGASVAYEFIDTYGVDGISKLVLIDEPPVLLVNPAWTKTECEQYGAIYQAADLHDMTNQFVTENSDAFKQGIISRMTTQQATKEQQAFILKCMNLSGKAAAQLYFNNISQDYRDVLKKITVPTLLVTGKASIHPWQSHQWMQSQIPNATLEVFEVNEGGSHFMFVENPEKFNQVILKFTG